MKAGPLVVALVLAASCTSPPPVKIDPAQFEPLHRAARATRTQTAVGVTLPAFRDLVGKYATEVSLAGDRAHSPLEQQLVGLHAGALTAYRDSLTIWEKKLEAGKDTAITLTLWGSVGVRKIAEEYAVAGEPIQDDSYRSYSLDAIMRAAWHRAEGKLDAADALYRGGPPKAP